ncbi:hypothetical protein M0805_003000 [Coniferiporia weirii]|nr:hypothetical protein M0805_003000 [Coniferiporia weirii]
MPTSRPRIFQIIMSGPNVDFHALKTNNGVEALQAELRAHTRRSELKVMEITWQAEWRTNLRILKQLRVGNVFIIGDAAHVQSPAGTQGMNAAIQDAFNLGWKLACALKGHAGPSLLDSYEAERLPANAEMLKMTAELHGETYLKEQGYAGFSAVGATPPAANKVNPWFRPRELFQLDGVLYDRAPDAPGLTTLATAATGLGERAPTRLFDIIKPTSHTALIFSTLHFSAETRAWTLGPLKNLAPGLVCTGLVFPSGASVNNSHLSALDADYVLKDAEENAFKSYGVTFGDATVVVIVRPDGMIGAFATTAGGIEKYFSAVCSCT